MYAGASDLSAARDAALPPLIVVVVNWNGRALLDDCLGSLLENGYDPLHIILVDNASGDDSVRYVEETFPAVEVMVAPENLRWAGGNNLVLRRLRVESRPGRYVLLLNNDTFVPEGSLQRLVAALVADQSAWAATPRVCYAHDPARIWYDGGRVGKYSGWIQHYGIRQLAGRRPLINRYVDYGTGCALLLADRALREVGEIDESYHFYGEDTDYSLRIRAAGGKILHVPKALILHKVSATLGSGSPRKAYLRSRSHIMLLRRHWPHLLRPGLLGGQLAYYGGLAAWHLWRGRWQTAYATLQGALDELSSRRPDRWTARQGQ